MELVKSSINRWINAAIVLTLGILIIIMGANTKASGDSADAISNILGIISIIIGSIALVIAIVIGFMGKKSFSVAGVSAGMTLALGISLVVGKYAAALIALFLYIIPFVLIVVGAVILLDSIYTMVLAIIAKKPFVAQIVSILVGLIAAILGFLCVGNNPIISQNAQLVTFGIIVVVYGALMVLGTFFTLPNVTVVTVEEKE